MFLIVIQHFLYLYYSDFYKESDKYIEILIVVIFIFHCTYSVKQFYDINSIISTCTIKMLGCMFMILNFF